MFRMIKAALLGAVSLLVTAPASHATAILVGQCIEFAACFSSGPTPWSDNLTTANLTALGLGTTQPLVAAQTSMTTIRLGVTTIDFATTTGPVVEMLPEFSGGIHSDPCNFCEIDIVGDFLIPANATSATISGFFGNSVNPTSAGVDVCLGSGVPCAAAAAPEPGSLAILGVALAGLGVARRRRNTA